jgi:hypothetical protein
MEKNNHGEQNMATFAHIRQQLNNNWTSKSSVSALSPAGSKDRQMVKRFNIKLGRILVTMLPWEKNTGTRHIEVKRIDQTRTDIGHHAAMG